MSESLLQKYGTFFVAGQQLRIDAGESVEMRLQPDKLPKELVPLLPYAEFWGIADDSYRVELVKIAPAEAWRDFQTAVSERETSLLEWLSGPGTDSPRTSEYLALSFMLQAFDWPRD